MSGGEYVAVKEVLRDRLHRFRVRSQRVAKELWRPSLDLNQDKGRCVIPASPFRHRATRHRYHDHTLAAAATAKDGYLAGGLCWNQRRVIEGSCMQRAGR